MQIECTTTIEAPLKDVWAIFEDPEKMKQWQPSLKELEPVEGKPGQPGAVTKLIYDDNGQRIEMTETITDRKDNEYLAGRYETSVATNTIENHFTEKPDGKTEWRMVSDFQFHGLIKLAAPLMKGSVRKRTEADMQRFKELAEQSTS